MRKHWFRLLHEKTQLTFWDDYIRSGCKVLKKIPGSHLHPAIFPNENGLTEEEL